MSSEQAGGLEVRSSWHYSPPVEDNNYHLEGLNRQNSRAASRNLRARNRKCRSPYRHVVFTILICFIIATYGAIVHSYYDGVLNAIQTRFDITHGTALCIMYIRDAATVLTLIFACYCGSRSHPPRVISLGAFICGVGIICCGLPHFVQDDPSISELDVGLSNATITTTTEEAIPLTDIYGEITNKLLCSATGDNAHEIIGLHDDNCPENNIFVSSSELSRAVLVIVGQVLCGIGIGPILPLSVMYLDDGIDKAYTSMVVGVFIIALVVGPMAGYFAWQFCLDIPVEFYMPREAGDERDTDSVGAWWLGFVAGGGFIILLSFPLMFFPKSLLPNAHDDDIDGEEDVAYRLIVKKRDNAGEKGCLKGLCFSLGRLLKNAAFTSMVVGLTCEVAIISGFFFLSGKYMLKQFETDLNATAVIVVTISLPGIIFGQIIGGYIVRKWRLDAKCCARMVFFMCVVSVCCTPLLILIGCGNPKIAGYTTEYPAPLGNFSTANNCNEGCGCDDHVYEPVCDGNGITYVSPCHAGCRSILHESMYKYVFQLQNRTIYTACQCVHWEPAYGINPSGGYAFEGPCQPEPVCDQKIYLFVGAYVALSLITSILGNPAFVVVVRSVHQYDRAMAVGVTSLMLRVFGFIPAPFYLEAVLKFGCWIRDFSCEKEGDCLLYDAERYRYIFIGMFLCLKFLALLAYTITNCVVRKESDEERYEKIPMTHISDSHSEDLMGTDV
ncbi:solute carrier organic anion transporter family member 3A1-like isoform X2 [Antedon mediterranea]|uniref:solute carrier organic anion transporter family member 3A1-like isoform X2 n=1 Tax=Antedon mediterranea TaxID=105859 RepID=UPI003AF82980